MLKKKKIKKSLKKMLKYIKKKKIRKLSKKRHFSIPAELVTRPRRLSIIGSDKYDKNKKILNSDKTYLILSHGQIIPEEYDFNVPDNINLLYNCERESISASSAIDRFIFDNSEKFGNINSAQKILNNFIENYIESDKDNFNTRFCTRYPGDFIPNMFFTEDIRGGSVFSSGIYELPIVSKYGFEAQTPSMTYYDDSLASYRDYEFYENFNPYSPSNLLSYNRRIHGDNNKINDLKYDHYLHKINTLRLDDEIQKYEDLLKKLWQERKIFRNNLKDDMYNNIRKKLNEKTSLRDKHDKASKDIEKEFNELNKRGKTLVDIIKELKEINPSYTRINIIVVACRSPIS
jgi:hypothetical protein